MNNTTGDQSPDGNYQVIKITCPACQYRMDAQLRREKTTTMCPECWEDVTVPSAATVQSRNASAGRSGQRQQQAQRKTPSRKRKPTDQAHGIKQTQAGKQPQATAGAQHQAADTTDVCTTVTCHTCRARVQARLSEQPGQVTCPDCFLEIPVPRFQDVAPDKRFAQPSGNDQLDHYQLAAQLEPRPIDEPIETDRGQSAPGSGDDTPPSRNLKEPTGNTTGQTSGKRNRLQRRSKTASRTPDTEPVLCTTVTCQTCHARVEAVLTGQMRQVTCPDCSLDIRVPRLQDVPENKRFPQPDGDEQSNHYRTTERPDPAAAESDSDPSTPAVPNPRRNTRPERTQTDNQSLPPAADKSEHPAAFAITGLAVGLGEPDYLRIEPPQKPPRWTFFSGVFSFPWYPEIRSRWLGLSCGCLVITWVFLEFILPILTGGIGSLNFGSAILFVTLGAFEAMLTGFVGAYATAHLLPVLVETASGSDHISGWPELGINDWLSDMFSIAIPISAVAAATYGCAQLVQSLNGPPGPAAVAVFPLILAVALLSSLESGSPGTILTSSILRSIGKHWSAWAMFYAVSTSLLGAWVILVVLIGNSPGWASLVAGPSAAALMFIYARLLGRLGWKAATRKRRKKKRGKPASTSQ